ncbi:26S proteasome regulatory complex, non-ATPase subcomplex, Rpn2/Psmd1 subunit [Cystobasidium minutum MCA 4210]|uniref:26S proteasome regulatory complex, non-ATPase subcomplex, Rpn2/Psmd1 subunit n=1 Tax=Cystobasidium minutum MCA 4210 TaxID=1397322 RepID=UPI0034D01A76|eukprot:jgi/Rhomi1/156959/estExt_Genewise1Plus.C_1_t20137
MTVSSAAGILALLSEDDPTLIHYALQQLNTNLVNSFWTEISDYLSSIEVIYENTSDYPLETRQLAALLASKVYYHLDSLDDALTFALSAGDLFNVDSSSSSSEEQQQPNGDLEYTETIIATCIDRYVENRIAQEEGSSPLVPSAISISSGKKAEAATSSIPPSQEDMDKMQAIVERMFTRCIRDGENKQAVGIALDARRLDVIERIFNETKDSSILTYILEAAMTIVLKLDFRNKVLRLLVQLFSSLPSPDHFSMLRCFVHLNDPTLATNLLTDLLSPSSLKQDPDNLLKAYQIAFDLVDTASQEFLGIVAGGLSSSSSTSSVPTESTTSMETDQKASSSSTSEIDPEVINKLQSILSGRETISLQLEFLYSHAKTDLQIVTKTKDTLEARNSINHSAVTFNNAFMNAGTCSDKFLRDNLEWLSKASNWSKFSATAALGVIHRGNLEYGFNLLQPYLPSPEGGSSGGAGASVYSEGGALYALGLVHANNGAAGGKAKEALRFLRTCLKAEGGEVVQHGAALGLGVAAMATGNEEIYDELRDILFLDSAVAGEAAGYAMGLVMLGTASTKAIDEMLQYAHETQHEKIIRGLAVGLSLLMYGKQEEADSLIDTLMSDQDPILRYGGIHTIAMAYAGTGANSAIRRLLHVAVSDVNDDVRRAAVTSLGFILFRSPAQVPRVVQLLSESYNPHVRYGATIALSISCAGTGLREAIEILEPLTKDPVDFVRQGSCIALAMILIQQNATLNPKVDEARKLFEKIISDKHEDPMAKFGASLSQGLIDAGGRNVTISLMSRNGNMSMPAVVGLALFTQFWYWFPMAHAAVLAFSPTAIIGVNSELKLPKFEFTSNVRPSIFAYVPEMKAPEKETVEMVKTAVLSTTAKASARQKEKEKEKAAAEGGDAMDTDEHAPKDKESSEKASEEDAEMKVDAEGGETKTEEKKAPKETEPNYETLPNLSRVVPAQMPYISFHSSSRFVPVRPLISSSSSTPVSYLTQAAKAANSASVILESIVDVGIGLGADGGILVLKDTKPDEPVEYVELKAKKALAAAAGPEEIEVPADLTGAGAANVAAQPPQPAPGVDLNAPIASMPEPFQYDDFED